MREQPAMGCRPLRVQWMEKERGALHGLLQTFESATGQVVGVTCRGLDEEISGPLFTGARHV